jgi:hypothetical protein
MRLQAEQPEVALHAALGDAGLSGHRAHAPVGRAVDRSGVQRCLDKTGQALIVDAAGRARPHIVVQPGDAALDEASTPLAHSGFGQIQARGDRAVGFAVRAAQDDASSYTQRRRHIPTACKRRELRSLVVCHLQRRLRPASAHRGISLQKILRAVALFMPIISGTGH